MTRVYNLKKAVKTGHEKHFSEEHHTMSTAALPTSYDLRITSTCVAPVLDQGNLGTCAANEMANALRFCIAKEMGTQSAWLPSRLFIYYFGRMFEGDDVSQDSGMSISGVCGAMAKYGAPAELLWPYDITQYAKQPSRSAILAAHVHTPGYQFLAVPQDLTHMKQSLCSGFPIIVGVQLYSNFESQDVADYGVVQLPTTSETLLGGHAILCVAYDDLAQRFTCSNSWGTGWGYKGFFTIPYAYLLNPNLAGDFNQVRYFK